MLRRYLRSHCCDALGQKSSLLKAHKQLNRVCGCHAAYQVRVLKVTGGPTSCTCTPARPGRTHPGPRMYQDRKEDARSVNGTLEQQRPQAAPDQLLANLPFPAVRQPVRTSEVASATPILLHARQITISEPQLKCHDDMTHSHTKCMKQELTASL